jgi:hypothetical protein
MEKNINRIMCFIGIFIVMKVLKVFLLIMLFTSCGSYKYTDNGVVSIEKEITQNYNIQNYREYKKQELIYYRYTLERNSDTRKGEGDTPKKSEERNETPAVKHKEELIQTLESKGLKPCKFVEKVLKKGVCGDTLDKTSEIIEDPTEESKPKKGLLKNKDKEYRQWFWQGFFKIISSLYFIFLAITNFQLFTMIFPTAICLLACICYPIWWKRGYLDTPYAKILTFIAAYGGLFANILWIILYI